MERIIFNIAKNPIDYLVFYFLTVIFWINLLSGSVQYFLLVMKFPKDLVNTAFKETRFPLKRVIRMTFYKLDIPPYTYISIINGVGLIILGSFLPIFIITTILINMMYRLIYQSNLQDLPRLFFCLLLYLVTYFACLFYGTFVYRKFRRFQSEITILPKAE